MELVVTFLDDAQAHRRQERGEDIPGGLAVLDDFGIGPATRYARNRVG